MLDLLSAAINNIQKDYGLINIASWFLLRLHCAKVEISIQYTVTGSYQCSPQEELKQQRVFQRSFICIHDQK